MDAIEKGFHVVKSRTLRLFTPCHSISKPIVILRGKKSQGKVSRGKESQGKVSRGITSLYPKILDIRPTVGGVVKIYHYYSPKGITIIVLL